MSTMPQVQADAPAPIDLLKLRAEARAILWAVGVIATIPEAVDELRAFAVSSGLVNAVGQDRVQQVLSDAFLPHRKAEWMAQSAELDQPAAGDDHLADHHQADDDPGAIWCGTCARAPCSDPGFCRACRGVDRRLAATPQPKTGPQPTPQTVIEAVMFAVSERGTAALLEPENVERLGRCDAAATAEIERRMSKLLEPTDASGS
jgi:hypothetical protein